MPQCNFIQAPHLNPNISRQDPKPGIPNTAGSQESKPSGCDPEVPRFQSKNWKAGIQTGSHHSVALGRNLKLDSPNLKSKGRNARPGIIQCRATIEILDSKARTWAPGTNIRFNLNHIDSLISTHVDREVLAKCQLRFLEGSLVPLGAPESSGLGVLPKNWVPEGRQKHNQGPTEGKLESIFSKSTYLLL